MPNTLTIGQVATQAGVGADTIRYYEKRGLIPKPLRRPSGYRAFPAETIARIRFIKRAQELGFTLQEIGQLARLRYRHGAESSQVQRIAANKIELIDAKIDALRAMRRALAHLRDRCAGNVADLECPIIESLDDRGPR